MKRLLLSSLVILSVCANAASARDEVPVPSAHASQRSSAAGWDSDYSVVGPNFLKPKSVFDNGQQTVLHMVDTSLVPTIFAQTIAGDVLIQPVHDPLTGYLTFKGVEQSFRLEYRGAKVTVTYNKDRTNPAGASFGAAQPVIRAGVAPKPLDAAQHIAQRNAGRPEPVLRAPEPIAGTAATREPAWPKNCTPGIGGCDSVMSPFPRGSAREQAPSANHEVLRAAVGTGAISPTQAADLHLATISGQLTDKQLALLRELAKSMEEANAQAAAKKAAEVAPLPPPLEWHEKPQALKLEPGSRLRASIGAYLQANKWSLDWKAPSRNNPDALRDFEIARLNTIEASSLEELAKQLGQAYGLRLDVQASNKRVVVTNAQ